MNYNLCLRCEYDKIQDILYKEQVVGDKGYTFYKGKRVADVNIELCPKCLARLDEFLDECWIEKEGIVPSTEEEIQHNINMYERIIERMMNRK